MRCAKPQGAVFRVLAPSALVRGRGRFPYGPVLV